MSLPMQSFEPPVGDVGGSTPSRVLVVDNYDSFTFNLVQYLLELGARVDVIRNDAATAEEVVLGMGKGGTTHLLLSPGPGTPRDSGICQELARRVSRDLMVPTLGVCLGHQTLCEVLGATVLRAGRIMHGKLSSIEHDGEGVFAGLGSPYQATRYHSLIVDEQTLPPVLRPVARTPEGELMAVAHVNRPVFGVQFHPESILTDQGHALLRNFLSCGPAGLPTP